MRTLFLVSCLIVLSGCASINNPFSSRGIYAGITPPQIHMYDKKADLKNIQETPIPNEKGLDSSVKNAEAQPYVDYFSALADARATPTEPAAIKKYLRAGVTVVNVSCLRWFQSLSNAEIRFDFAQANQNVIQNLGTTLLGLGKANPVSVGVYGAGFTALNGIEKSFSQSFFLAPNANKVKSHIFSVLDQRAEEILSGPVDKNKIQKPIETFTEAYLTIERYADICTQQTAKEIINSSLDQTKTELITNDGGKVKTVMTLDAVNSDNAKNNLKILIDKDVDARVKEVVDKSAEVQKRLEKSLEEIAILKRDNENLIKITQTQSEIDRLNNAIKELREENTKLKNDTNK